MCRGSDLLDTYSQGQVLTNPRRENGGMNAIIVRVRLEPDLEDFAGHLSPDEREIVARKFYRWAKQLWVTAQALRPHPVRQAGSPRKARRV